RASSAAGGRGRPSGSRGCRRDHHAARPLPPVPASPGCSRAAPYRHAPGHRSLGGQGNPPFDLSDAGVPRASGGLAGFHNDRRPGGATLRRGGAGQRREVAARDHPRHEAGRGAPELSDRGRQQARLPAGTEMTPEERDRLAKVEAEVKGIKDWLREIHADQKKMLAAMNMGEGAWKATLKIGGLLVLAAGALAWVFDRFRP